MKKRGQIHSRPKQRRALEAKLVCLLEGRRPSGKEVKTFGGDEFPAKALSSLLSPDPGYSEKTLRRALAWLNSGYKNNGDMRGSDVSARLNEFQAYVAAWRENLILQRRSSTDRYARREAETLLTLTNAWAAGDLPAVRTCMQCATYFLATRSTNQFCSDGCRSTFYHDLETLHPEYKARKAREAVVRRRNAKAKHLVDDVLHTYSVYQKLPKTQLDKKLADVAQKFNTTMEEVKKIARVKGLDKG